MLSCSSCYIRISNEAKESLKQRVLFEEEMSQVVYDESDSLVFHPGSFTALSNRSLMDVTFIQSDCEPMVVVTGKYKSRDSIRVENVDGTLRILFENRSLGILYRHDEKVTVYAPGIECLTNFGSGDVTVKGALEAGSFEILNQGSGDIEMEKGVFNGPVSIDNQGSGDISFGSCMAGGTLRISNRGSGDITVKGKSGETKVSNHGSGDIDISRLECTLAEVISQGSGDVFKP